MKIPLLNIDTCFKKIRKRAVLGSVCAVIYVSFSTDSICALTILSELLKKQNILYKIYPVQGYESLMKCMEDSKIYQNLTIGIFLNCGGIIDLTEQWFSQQDSKIKSFLFDYHRPIHHNNINKKKKVYVIDDGFIDCPNEDDFQFLENFNQTENDDEIENEKQNYDEENEEQFQLQVDKQNQVNNSNQQNDENQENFNQKRKRQQQLSQEKKLEKKIKLQKQQLIQNYYNGQYFGTSTSYLMLYLAMSIDQVNNDLLWYAILGLTDMLINGQICKKNYEEKALELSRQVMKINGTGQQMMDLGENILINSNLQKTGFIYSEMDYQFMLMRHWTLYKSIYYSNYVSPRLGIWRDKKRTDLNDMLLQLGIPLEQSNKDYQLMDMKYKQNLKLKIEEISNKFKLYDIMYQSFIRQLDAKAQISATDMTHVLNSILQCPQSVLDYKYNHYNPIKDLKIVEENKKEQEVESQDRAKNFQIAYQILQNNIVDDVLTGIQIAKEFQEQLVDEAISLIERKCVESTQEFRYAILTRESLQQKKYFQHPYSLQKLAFYLMEIFREKKKDKSKPIVLCIKNEVTQNYTVIGVVGNYGYTANNKNEFGIKFREAAEKCKLKFKQDEFESSIIEIANEDFETFLEEIIIVK